MKFARHMGTVVGVCWGGLHGAAAMLHGNHFVVKFI